MEIHKEIKNAIQNNSLVLFIGSGLSARFNLPTWNKLVKDIISDIDSEKYKSFLPVLNAGLMTPLEILDKLEDESHTIKKYIKNNFKVDRSCDFSLHEKYLN